MLYLLAGAGGLAIAFGIAVVVARSITGPLSRLTTRRRHALDRAAARPGPAAPEPGGRRGRGHRRVAHARSRSTPRTRSASWPTPFNSIQARDRRGGRGAGPPAPQGHRRHLRQPGPPQPDACSTARSSSSTSSRQRATTPTSSTTCSSSTTSPPGCGATPSRCSSWPAPSRPAAVAARCPVRRRPRRHRRGRGLPAGPPARPRRRHRRRQRGRRPRPPALRAHGERHQLLAAAHQRRDRSAATTPATATSSPSPTGASA